MDKRGHGGGQRRLAAILAADVAGYSRQIALDEAGALARLREARIEVLDPLVAAHGGRVFKAMGDGFLVEFPSAVEALRCALAFQDCIGKRNAALPKAERLSFRLGLHQGDVVMAEDGDVLGDGVNIAARLERLAEPDGIVISARVREDVAGKLALEVEDLGECALKNIPQPVRLFRLRSGASLGTADPPRRPLPLPQKPSLVVLPFQNMSGDPEQEYFADGITEELTTALSRVRSFFIIARNTAFTYKGRAVDVRQVGRELGVRYVLEGSVRKSGNRVRITGQLVEAETRNHIWAHRFDDELADIFALQDRVAGAVAGAIEPSLREAEIERVRRKPTESLDAYDYYLRALPQFYAFTAEGTNGALTLLRSAIALDPDFAPAKARAAFCQSMRVVQGQDTPGDSEEGVRLAQEAIASGLDDPATLAWAAVVLAYPGWDHSPALAAAERAVTLNPNSAEAQLAVGWINVWLCRPEIAITHLEHALRLSPLGPHVPHALSGLGVAYLIAGKHQMALDASLKVLQQHPSWATAHRATVTALSFLGRREEAAVAALRYREIAPASARVFAERERRLFVDAEFVAARSHALREAGLPE